MKTNNSGMIASCLRIVKSFFEDPELRNDDVITTAAITAHAEAKNRGATPEELRTMSEEPRFRINRESKN